MSGKKNQKIIVLTSLSDADKSIINHGVKMALMFRKDLCLAYHLNKKDRKNRNLIELRLNKYLGNITTKAPDLHLSVLLTEEPLRHLPETMANSQEAIMLITTADEYKKYAVAVIESPIPFLFAGRDSVVIDYKKVVLPVDLRRENSDTALWCTWFGRFGHSEITVIAANDGNKSSQDQVMRNVKLTKSLLQKTGVNHKIIKGRRSSFYNSFEAAEFALAFDAGLLVLLGSSTITPLDRLVGLPEKKIINHAGKIPVLLVNPRRDNYILCD